MATRKTIEKIMRNGEPYYLGYDSSIEIQKNGTKVDDFTLNQSTDKVINIPVPTNSDYVDLSTAQTVNGVKTFGNEPVLPAKQSSADSSKTTSPATEAQVAQKQDSLTLPSTPTSGHLVKWGANNKTLTDGGELVEISKSDMDTGTGTTAGIVAPKSIADYVKGMVGSGVNYKGQVTDYSDLPATPSTGDMYNVVNTHTSAPKFDAGTNVVWNGTGWDPMAEMVDLSNLVDKTTNQTIGGVKTFTSEPVLPSKSTAPGNEPTKPATEKQVKDVADSINNTTVSFTQAGDSAGSFTTNQPSASTIVLTGNKLVTATEYTNLPSSKTTDGNRYFQYSVQTISE